MANPKTDMARAFEQWETIERTRAITKDSIEQQTTRAEETVRPDGGMDVTTPPERIGRLLHVDEMKRKLLKINPNFRFEIAKADPSKMGIYVLSQLRNPATGGFDRIFVCGMESGLMIRPEIGIPAGMMPEYSIIKTAEVSMPDPEHPVSHQVRVMDVEIRGWRTVLASLLKARLITPAQIEAHFPVNLGVSEHWQQKANPKIEVTDGSHTIQ